MEIAVLADIHGNYHALIAVLEDLSHWKPDLVYVLGDTINRGPRSQNCLQLVREKQTQSGWKIITGNHEKYVLDFDDPATPLSGPAYQILKIVHWTYRSLHSEEIAYIKTLPEKTHTLLPDKKRLTGVHASMLGLRDGIFPDTPDHEVAGMIQPAPDLLVIGHTHQPLIRQLNQTTIINAGSVGLPFDGDQRAAYAQIHRKNGNWIGEIIRIPYDIEAAEKDFQQFGFLDEGGPMAEVVLTELKLARPQLSHWIHKYQKDVMAGNLSVGEAVRRYLITPNLSCPR